VTLGRRAALWTMASGLRGMAGLAGLSALSVLSAGCSRQGADGPAGSGPQHLVVGIGADQTSVQHERANIGMSTPQANLCEALTQMGDDWQVLPGLALRWELRDATTWRFYLRPGVLFHDGSPFGAQDVVWSLDRFAKARGPGNLIDAQVGSTRAVDDLTVEFTPARPQPNLPGLMVHRSSLPMLKAGSDPATLPIGTGPFRFEGYEPRRSFSAMRFDGYWDATARARLDRITWRYLPDADARILALKAGDIDVALDIPRDQAAALEKDTRLRLLRSRPGSYLAVSFLVHPNGAFRLGADRVVRQAVSLAIDRQAIVDRVLAGNAAMVRHLNPPGVLGSFDALVQGPRYDADAARSMLEAAGWKRGADGVRERAGQRLRLTLVSGFPNAEIHRPIPEVLQAQLREVGIELQVVEPPSFDAALTERQGDLWLERGAYNVVDPNFLVSLLYRSVAGGGGGAYAPAFGIGGTVDEHANLASAASGERRQHEAALAMQALIDEHRVVIPLAGLFSLAAARASVHDLALHSSGVHQRWNGVRKG